MRGKRGVLLIAFVFLLSSVSATNVGVSPANINFLNVLRNGYAERPIIITIDNENPVDVSLTTRGEISEWLNFSETNFSVSGSYQLLVSVTPPEDIPNGVYEGFIRIISSKLGGGQEGHATGLIIPTLDVFVRVQVTDQEILSCKASNFQVESAEEGDDIIFNLDVKNNGNIRIFPEITFEVWDQESINLVKQFEFSETEVIPTKSGKLIIKMPSDDLELGQYWVDISSVDCGNSQTLTFDILEEGALRANANLERIIVEPWATVGDIVPISVNFRNTGEKSIDSRFIGKIISKDKIVQILESDEDVFVQINEQSNFQFYFTPKQTGKYIISGRVFYDGKRTYEQSAILNVTPQGPLTSIIKIATYIILILIISILLFKIRKERKSYSRQLRRIKK